MKTSKFEKADKKADKKQGVKEGSKKDISLDKKTKGVLPPRMHAKVLTKKAMKVVKKK